jgi:hypothetical protein
MRKKTWRVTLTDTERASLLESIAAGRAPARKLAHARILLKADESPTGPGWGDRAIAEAFEVSLPTIGRVRKRFVTEGLDAALNHRAPQPTGRAGWMVSRKHTSSHSRAVRMSDAELYGDQWLLSYEAITLRTCSRRSEEVTMLGVTCASER